MNCCTIYGRITETESIALAGAVHTFSRQSFIDTAMSKKCCSPRISQASSRACPINKLFTIVMMFLGITECRYRACTTNGSDCGSLRSHNLTLFVLPCIDFVYDFFHNINSPVEALPKENVKFDFCHIQPTSMFWREDKFKPVPQ